MGSSTTTTGRRVRRGGWILLWLGLLALGAAPVSAAEIGVVTRVLDGDTIEVRLADGTAERVRLIGVNAPEKSSKLPCERAWASAAMSVTLRSTMGRQVRLEGDITPVDRYDRRLAYVYVPQPEGQAELFLQPYLLTLGLAWVGEMGDNTRFRAAFQALEAEAKAAGRGLWGE